MAGWMVVMGRRIKHTSLRKYMSALPYGQAIQPVRYPWSIVGSEVIRKTLRFIKHRYPCSAKRSKLPITLSLIRKLATHLPHFPRLDHMAFDDVAWLVASVVGTSAFLRGGEFLSSPKSDRAILAMSDISLRTLAGSLTLVVSPPQPKTRLDLTEVSIPCFAPPSAGPLNPASLFQLYKRRSPCLGGVPSLTPAFHTRSGQAMSKAWLLSRTQELMAAANIAVVDPTGKPTQINASSWRAGGVRSALDAGLSDSVIMEFGRWRSAAWKHYLMFSPLDIQGACRRLWDASASESVVVAVSTQVGGSFDCVPSTRSAQAVARAKAQITSAVCVQSVSPEVRLAQTTSAFAMIDATMALLQSC